ncbi:MAG: hypothetical protein COS39_07565 [Hydrogenophilales bacterium CG03_land_8_20_14_0_80_62_28]|nr:HDOD domain-containing protein [Betaproteobacteria bacterium]PIV22463.1 MAG: hypothetical protein COS39_07565 [Hydrogenophilales bacterium CG03_land_8_20_14_0_80_62_28]
MQRYTGLPYLVRQPLLDGRYRVAGYQLSLSDRALVPVLPGAESLAQARDERLLTSVIDLEYQNALGERLMVLDLAPSGLTNPMLAQLPAGKVALSLPTAALDLAENLSRMGILALLKDDGGELPAILPPACLLARLDSSSLDAIALAERVEQLRRLGVKRLIAANVDSEEAFEVCRRLGFDLYQGGFLIQPRAGGTGKLDSGVMQVMELLNLAHEQAPVERLEAVFKRDAAMTYRLLRYINSSANGLGRTIQSIGHALVWLGYEPLYRWLTLLLFSTGKGDGRNAALLQNALTRARFMENLGQDRLPRGQLGGVFIVGILSHLDALLDRPMAEAIAPLQLPETMAQALLVRQGPYAPYLQLAVACERFDQQVVERYAAVIGLPAEQVDLAHVNALIWSATLDI